MKIDLSELVVDSARNNHNNERFVGKTKEFTVKPEFESVEHNHAVYEVAEAADVCLTVKALGENKVNISGQGSIVLNTPCDRCIEIQATSISYKLDRDIDFDNPDPVEDCGLIEDKCIDVDNLLYPEIIINFPMKILCKEDCKGICRVCGINLNKQSCDCDTFVPDPRMAVISDIFKQFNQ